MTTATATKLVCPECRRENEAERIYCHDCGARLDRSAVAKAKAKEEDPKETQRRLQTMFDPRRALLKQRVFQGAKLILGALVAAGLVQMLRPPDLPAEKESADMPAQINLDLENASMDSRVAPPHYSQDQVNEYLKYVLKGKRAALSKYLEFDRTVAVFDEGAYRATVERSLFGFPLYTSVGYAIGNQKGKTVAKLRSGHIGRMPIHPALMQFGDFLFADVRAALEREQKSIAKLGGVELHPQTIAFLPRPPQT